MKYFIIGLALSTIAIKSYAKEFDQDFYSERLIESAKETIEKSKLTREELDSQENFREIAKEKDEKWYNEMEEIINK